MSCPNCQHEYHGLKACEKAVSFRAGWSGLIEDGECGCVDPTDYRAYVQGLEWEANETIQAGNDSEDDGA
jgi:hypothetical protein